MWISIEQISINLYWQAFLQNLIIEISLCYMMIVAIKNVYEIQWKGARHLLFYIIKTIDQVDLREQKTIMRWFQPAIEEPHSLGH